MEDEIAHHLRFRSNIASGRERPLSPPPQVTPSPFPLFKLQATAAIQLARSAHRAPQQWKQADVVPSAGNGWPHHTSEWRMICNIMGHWHGNPGHRRQGQCKRQRRRCVRGLPGESPRHPGQPPSFPAGQQVGGSPHENNAHGRSVRTLMATSHVRMEGDSDHHAPLRPQNCADARVLRAKGTPPSPTSLSCRPRSIALPTLGVPQTGHIHGWCILHTPPNACLGMRQLLAGLRPSTSHPKPHIQRAKPNAPAIRWPRASVLCLASTTPNRDPATNEELRSKAHHVSGQWKMKLLITSGSHPKLPTARWKLNQPVFLHQPR